MSREDLAARQAALVAAMVAGADPPPGFDTHRLTVATRALLNKRAGEAQHAWPLLVAALDDRYTREFAAYFAGRPRTDSFRDGWDLARHLAAEGRLPPLAEPELAARESLWHYDGTHPPRRRRLPSVRRTGTTTAIQFLGRAVTRSREVES